MQRRTWKSLKPAAAVVVAVTTLLAAGCTGGGESGDDGNGEAASAEAPPLVAGAPSGPITNNNNPYVNTSAATVLGYSKVIFEPLAQTNAVDPTAEPTPWLATEWEWAGNFTSLTVTMRDGVQWTDGEPATAADIAFTFGMFKDHPALNTLALPVASATADGATATITFATSQFVNQDKVLQALIVPEHLWSTLPDPAKDTIENPVGTGPYTLTSWTQQAVTVDRNEDYWGGTPAVPQIRYVPYNDGNALITALGEGEVQWTGVAIPDPEAQYLGKDPDNRMWFPSGLPARTLFFNTAEGPFSNAALRQATDMVIDRERIIAEAYNNEGAAIASPTGIAEPAGAEFIAAKYQGEKHEVDVEGAREVLTDAGYTYVDDQLHDPDGEPVTVTLTDPTAFNQMLTALQIISQQLAEIGVTATVEPQDATAWQTSVAQGDFDATFSWTEVGSTPYSLYRTFMDGDALQPIGTPATANFGRFDNAEAAEALRTYATTEDEAVRADALATLQDIQVSEVPAIPMAAAPFGSEFSVKHYVGWPDENDPYANPQPHGTNAAMILMNLELAGS
ncbi:ABC transporter substrate-binding protein [Jiangella anatolica]|nr:ABC transporter substrate-binding protein [Jiangella anatolica]